MCCSLIGRSYVIFNYDLDLDPIIFLALEKIHSILKSQVQYHPLNSILNALLTITISQIPSTSLHPRTLAHTSYPAEYLFWTPLVDILAILVYQSLLD